MRNDLLGKGAATASTNRYDEVREHLRAALKGRVADPNDLELAATSYAFWTCAASVRTDAEKSAILNQMVERAAALAAEEGEAERAEIALLRNVLSALSGTGLLLDIGAGWGRFAPLYRESGLTAVCVEPQMLGARLMQRAGIAGIAAAGEALPFPDNSFGVVVIGWVLHHRLPAVDARALLLEASRVLRTEGHLISIEPVREDFTIDHWLELMRSPGVGIAVEQCHEFHKMAGAPSGPERHTLLVGAKSRA